MHLWYENYTEVKIHYFQRAYEGPILKKFIISEILYYKDIACKILEINNEYITDEDIETGFQFLRLDESKQKLLQLHYPGPFSLFLPAGDNRYFIDFCYLRRFLPDLFFGVHLDNENFKGQILEDLIQPENKILPTIPCKAENGELKQIDCAFIIEDRLVIIECKAIGMSFGVEKGQTFAINFRSKKLRQALEEVDDKAKWLINNPIGKNYDISKIKEILPIVVTPFTEYIPKKNNFYWIDSNIPRVLSIEELVSYKDSNDLLNANFNVLPAN